MKLTLALILAAILSGCTQTPKQETILFDYNLSHAQNYQRARGKQIDLNSIRLPGVQRGITDSNQAELSHYSEVLLVNLCHSSNESDVQAACRKIKTDADWNLPDQNSIPLFWDAKAGRFLTQ